MNLKDYITIDEEVQPEQVKNNIPLLEVKVKFHIKGQPMPTPIDIVNINYKLQSHSPLLLWGAHPYTSRPHSQTLASPEGDEVWRLRT